MWHIHPLLGNDHEISSYTMARKQQQRNGVFCAVSAEML
jgi:hypothetical protein